MAEHSEATFAERLESACPELHSDVAQRIGHPGTVTVWDDIGRYVGFMGVELWKHLLTVEGETRRLREALTEITDYAAWQSAPNGADAERIAEIARRALA